jgi:hypothetical protein
MSKKIKFIAIISIVAAIFLAGILVVLNISSRKGYSIVYLVSGQAYVGKLSFFPKMELKDAYLFEMVKDPQDAAKNTFQLSPLKSLVWAPKTVYLVRENVIFYAPIEAESKIAEALKQKR